MQQKQVATIFTCDGNHFQKTNTYMSGCSKYVCMVITYSRVWINRVRLSILLVVSGVSLQSTCRITRHAGGY